MVSVLSHRWLLTILSPSPFLLKMPPTLRLPLSHQGHRVQTQSWQTVRFMGIVFCLPAFGSVVVLVLPESSDLDVQWCGADSAGTCEDLTVTFYKVVALRLTPPKNTRPAPPTNSGQGDLLVSFV